MPHVRFRWFHFFAALTEQERQALTTFLQTRLKTTSPTIQQMGTTLIQTTATTHSACNEPLELRQLFPHIEPARLRKRYERFLRWVLPQIQDWLTHHYTFPKPIDSTSALISFCLYRGLLPEALYLHRQATRTSTPLNTQWLSGYWHCHCTATTTGQTSAIRQWTDNVLAHFTHQFRTHLLPITTDNDQTHFPKHAIQAIHNLYEQLSTWQARCCLLQWLNLLRASAFLQFHPDALTFNQIMKRWLHYLNWTIPDILSRLTYFELFGQLLMGNPKHAAHKLQTLPLDTIPPPDQPAYQALTLLSALYTGTLDINPELPHRLPAWHPGWVWQFVLQWMQVPGRSTPLPHLKPNSTYSLTPGLALRMYTALWCYFWHTGQLRTAATLAETLYRLALRTIRAPQWLHLFRILRKAKYAYINQDFLTEAYCHLKQCTTNRASLHFALETGLAPFLIAQVEGIPLHEGLLRFLKHWLPTHLPPDPPGQTTQIRRE